LKKLSKFKEFTQNEGNYPNSKKKLPNIKRIYPILKEFTQD
jgi:hypothetical protein